MSTQWQQTFALATDHAAQEGEASNGFDVVSAIVMMGKSHAPREDCSFTACIEIGKRLNL